MSLTDNDIQEIAKKLYDYQCEQGSLCPMGLEEKDVRQLLAASSIASKIGMTVALVVATSAALAVLSAFGMGVRSVIKGIIKLEGG